MLLVRGLLLLSRRAFAAFEATPLEVTFLPLVIIYISFQTFDILVDLSTK